MQYFKLHLFYILHLMLISILEWYTFPYAASYYKIFKTSSYITICIFFPDWNWKENH